MEKERLNHKVFLCSETAQIIQMVIAPGQTVTAGIIFSKWFDDGIRFEEKANRPGTLNKSGFGKLLDSGIKKLGRDDQQVIYLTNSVNASQNISFGAPSGRQILSIALSEQDGNFFCHKDAFICAEAGLELFCESGRRSKSNFKGMGKSDWLEFRGNGTLFAHVGGATRTVHLKKQKMKGDRRAIIGFTGGITCDWGTAGLSKLNRSDAKSYYQSKLSGSGTVYLQSKPFKMPKQARRLTHDITELAPFKALALYEDNLEKIKSFQWSKLQDLVKKENLQNTLKTKIDLRSRLKKLTAKKG
ncbi:hypothetical protein D1AOALGA4SA_6396 [Olavius algarvensis Delta 1 endosymbiont]|nr:hypothetical protein D1AOALGA4SA_6396 [Olavius algarvensis Delta 1 endosymbiont]